MLKYVPQMTSVVLEEIPDRVTLAVDISNCPGHCEGCHSPFLREDIGEPLTAAIIDTLVRDNFGVNCFLFLGEGRDIARFYPRHGNSPVKPIIQGGPTGSPVSEEMFIKIMQSYAQEAVVDDLVDGVMDTVEGKKAKSGTPYEIRATMQELRMTKEARTRAGRPGLGV